MKLDEEMKQNMREGPFIEWLKEGASGWGGYPADVDAPESDAPEAEIKDYIKAVKERCNEIHQELVDSGADEFDIDYGTPEWPLKDDTPIEAVRAYLFYLEETEEAASKGIIID